MGATASAWKAVAPMGRSYKDTYGSNSLPGFMIPAGSSTALIPRISAISAALRVLER